MLNATSYFFHCCQIQPLSRFFYFARLCFFFSLSFCQIVSSIFLERLSSDWEFRVKFDKYEIQSLIIEYIGNSNENQRRLNEEKTMLLQLFIVLNILFHVCDQTISLAFFIISYFGLDFIR